MRRLDHDTAAVAGIVPAGFVLAGFVLAGLVLYAAIDTALLFLRPELSFLHSAESDYGSHGAWAWLMDLDFLLRGLLSLAAVRALALLPGHPGTDGRLRLGRHLLSVWAVASASLALFPDDPAGTPVHTSGRIHLLLAFVAFLAVVAGTILTSRALRARPEWSPVAIPMTVLSLGALVPLLLLGRAGVGAHALGGLYEKLFLGLELLWLALAAVWAARIDAGTRRAASRPVDVSA